MSKILAKHDAVIIKKYNDGTFEAAMEVNEACGSCAAQKVCGGDSQKSFKLVEDGLDRQVGDRVVLVINQSMGYLAVVLAYLVPIALIIGSLLIFNSLMVDEMIAGCSTLGIVAVYFVILRLFRKKIDNQITITIE